MRLSVLAPFVGILVMVAVACSTRVDPTDEGEATSPHGGDAGSSAGASGMGEAVNGGSAGNGLTTGGVAGVNGNAASGGAAGLATGTDAGTAGVSGGAGGKKSSVPRVTPADFLEIKVMRDLPNFDHNGIVLTFDDGPDGANNTSKVLDTLKAEGVKATFCLNDHNWGALREVQLLHEVVARIVADGHSVCNHTNHHWSLTSNIPEQKDANGKVVATSHAWTAADYDAEFNDIVTAVAEYAPMAPEITLTRAPFMNKDAQSMKYLQKYGLHLEVDIASGDSPGCQFKGDPNCVVNGVMNQVNAGAYGIVLLHSPVPETAMALPALIKQLKAKGRKFYTAEDVIKLKYGKTSHELYYPAR